MTKVLDLFCGEGGASAGYHQAGFEIFGVDTNPDRLKYYPYPHTKADALDHLKNHGHEYDLIHASPPCHGYSVATSHRRDRDKSPLLIAETRTLLEATGVPWVIENVIGARPQMRQPILLCGRMFSLQAPDTDGTLLVLDRHRLFESSMRLLPKAHLPHYRIMVGGSYGGGVSDRRRARYIRKGGYTPVLAVRQALLGTPWMTQKGCALAIPPAYTRHLGTQIKRILEAS